MENKLVELSQKKNIKIAESKLFNTAFYLIKGQVFYCSGTRKINEGDYNTFIKTLNNKEYHPSIKLIPYIE